MARISQINTDKVFNFSRSVRILGGQFILIEGHYPELGHNRLEPLQDIGIVKVGPGTIYQALKTLIIKLRLEYPGTG